jgi:hypothetical protein
MVGALNNEDFKLVVKRCLLLMKLSFIAPLPKQSRSSSSVKLILAYLIGGFVRPLFYPEARVVASNINFGVLRCQF